MMRARTSSTPSRRGVCSDSVNAWSIFAVNGIPVRAPVDSAYLQILPSAVATIDAPSGMKA
jgi:hypothetical protein